MDKKKIYQFLVALFVAVIFITSYLSFINFGSPLAQNTTKPVPQTVYAVGFANASIFSFTNLLNITVTCPAPNSTIVINNLTNTLNALQGNSSVLNVFPAGNNITIETGKLNALGVYARLYPDLDNSTAKCTAFKSAAVAHLPSTITMYVGTQTVSLGVGGNNTYDIPLTIEQNLSNTIRVRVAALFTTNGSIYGNLSVTKA